jgi:hypothetical protein
MTSGSLADIGVETGPFPHDFPEKTERKMIEKADSLGVVVEL